MSTQLWLRAIPGSRQEHGEIITNKSCRVCRHTHPMCAQQPGDRSMGKHLPFKSEGLSSDLQDPQKKVGMWAPGCTAAHNCHGRKHQVPTVADTTQGGSASIGKYLTSQPLDKIRKNHQMFLTWTHVFFFCQDPSTNVNQLGS